ncbi:MAG: serine--tRNA ligase [bacterium]
MLDIKFIRENPEKVKQGCLKRQAKIDIDQILYLDSQKRKLLQKIDNLRAERKKLEDLAKLKKIKLQLKIFESELKDINQKLEELMLLVPNLPFDEVPQGKSEKDNLVIKEVGEKTEKKIDYLTIAEKLDLIDIKRAAKTSGARFYFLKKELVLLEFALINFAFETLVKAGFTPILPPLMLKKEAMQGAGFPWEETFQIEKDGFYLIGTSEHAIAAMHSSEIIKDLPKRYVGFSACFRREAGSYGKDTRGILRVHQFDKAEMFSFCLPEKSQEEHKFLISIEESLMQALNLPYRLVQLCASDLGTASAMTYDIETWLPSEQKYRETHSCSNCTDFQARRLNIRYEPGKFVHTLNGTAFAVPRILIAILENYQQKNGSIEVPKALQKYTGFKKIG